VLVFDPSAVAKSGTASVGVARQWCGRLGKVENCQVGIYLGYVSRHEHALVDRRLYLPQEWTDDKARCRKAGVPQDRLRHRTRHQLCLDMLANSVAPLSWIAGTTMGRPTISRRRGLGGLSAGRAVNTLIVTWIFLSRRTRERAPISSRGNVDRWTAYPAEAWTRRSSAMATRDR
jgi:hypothetical protein